MAKDRGGWCQVFTGRATYPLDFRSEDIDPLDIAHSLALQCRFNGHCKTFYSVADHSLRVYNFLRRNSEHTRMSTPDTIALERKWALMHDAAEAYFSNIPRPVKHSLAGLGEIEASIEAAISKKFGILLPIPGIVKHVDLVLLATEARDLTPPPQP